MFALALLLQSKRHLEEQMAAESSLKALDLKLSTTPVSMSKLCNGRSCFRSRANCFEKGK
jgi:hypothetical protein